MTRRGAGAATTPRPANPTLPARRICWDMQLAHRRSQACAAPACRPPMPGTRSAKSLPAPRSPTLQACDRRVQWWDGIGSSFAGSMHAGGKWAGEGWHACMMSAGRHAGRAARHRRQPSHWMIWNQPQVQGLSAPMVATNVCAWSEWTREVEEGTAFWGGRGSEEGGSRQRHEAASVGGSVGWQPRAGGERPPHLVGGRPVLLHAVIVAQGLPRGAAVGRRGAAVSTCTERATHV